MPEHPQPPDDRAPPGDGPAASRVAGPAALLITLLLALQWPLRDVVGWGSTLANDVAQALFALYVAVGVAHAQHRGAHLVARLPDAAARAGRRGPAGAALAVLPWCVFLAASSLPAALQSLHELERFPETLNPGYVCVKLALLLLPVLLLLQLLAGLRRHRLRR